MSGPGIVEWLREMGVRDHHLSATNARTLRDWRAGKRPVSERKLDEICCEVGLHLGEVPDWAKLGWPEGAVDGLVLKDGWLVRERPLGPFEAGLGVGLSSNSERVSRGGSEGERGVSR